MRARAAIALLLATAVFVVGYASVRRGPDAGAGVEFTRAYATPDEVFAAFREACAKGDWPTVYSCLTAEARDDAIFEACFACNTRLHDPEVVALLAKHGVAPESVDRAYFERHEKKYGISATGGAEVREPASQESGDKDAAAAGLVDGPAPPQPHVDQELYRATLLALAVNRVQFFAEASELLAAGRPSSELGKLREVAVTGDTATGRADATLEHLESSAQGATRSVNQTIPKQFFFRKANGRWLIERM